MARSRTSGVQTEAEQATWARRRGTPGGARTEAEKLGLPVVPALPLAERPLTPEILAAWAARDQGRLRELLGLEVWQDGPWVAKPCEAPDHGGGHGRCRCAALALRARILAELEASDAGA